MMENTLEEAESQTNVSNRDNWQSCWSSRNPQASAPPKLFLFKETNAYR